MHWMLRTLPSDIAPKPGNEALVNWVRSQILERCCVATVVA
jgi:hypothetical protein